MGIVWNLGSRGARALLVLVAALAALPGLLQAQITSDGPATLVHAVGEVSVIRDNTLWILSLNDTVQAGQTITTGPDGFAEFSLADGSAFQVYPDSRVVFRRNPGTFRDLLDVFLGRVKVYIQHLGGRPNRHRVFTPTAVISVRGTVFEVSVDETETTIVAVDEGLVGVTHRLLPSNAEVPVEAGESLIVYPDAPLAKAGVDKIKAVRLMQGIARAAASIWQQNRGPGGTPAPGGGAGGGGGGLPGDTPAEPPPPPPPDGGGETAPAPPPAP